MVSFYNESAGSTFSLELETNWNIQVVRVNFWLIRLTIRVYSMLENRLKKVDQFIFLLPFIFSFLSFNLKLQIDLNF